MINYTSSTQLTIMEFKTPFQTLLDSDNKWVKLSKSVSWDKFASIYIKAMDLGFGRPGIAPRKVLGALIIKHLMNLDDRGTIEAIQENPYMQFFIRLSGFTTNPVFDALLFVDIRKRVGNETFDKLNTQLIKAASGKLDTIIATLYRQQREMYDNRINTCGDRIVSIHQPHVRPIKRGEQNSETEFQTS